MPRRLRIGRRAFPTAERGRRAHSPHFSVVVTVLSPTELKHGSTGGCAAVISKKTARRSVDRHLLKRRMLSVMRPWCTPQVSVIAYARAGAASLPFRTLTEELSLLLSHAVRVA